MDEPVTSRERWLANQIWTTGQFLRRIDYQLRYGELSREPLELLRFQVSNKLVECEWLVRHNDRWDSQLSEEIQRRHATLQILKDAIHVRKLLFATIPHVESAKMSAFRHTSDGNREMILTGYVHRTDNSSRSIHSIVMRAKVLGFRFDLFGDTLQSLTPQDAPPANERGLRQQGL